MKKISVIIPSFNASASIINSLNSIKNQTAFDEILEIIIVNDGSTDDTIKVIQDYIFQNPKMPIELINKKNEGVSSARNIGIKRAKGEWIALLDSDDKWSDEKIYKQIVCLKKHSNIKFIGSNRNKEFVKLGKKIDNNLFYLDVNKVLFKTWPHTSTAVIHKSVFEKTGFFDESRSHAEDGQLWSKIAYHFGIYYLYDSLEIAGDDKPTFGFSGLSANIEKMHEGCIKNIREAYALKYIGYLRFKVLIIFEKIKYKRRKIIVKKYENS